MTIDTLQNETTAEERTFTQAELNEIVGDRLARERKKYADYDELKDKAQQLEEIQQEAECVRQQYDELTKSIAVKEMRQKVSKATDVPVNVLELLHCDTEEEYTTQAQVIKEYARTAPRYPTSEDCGDIAYRMRTHMYGFNVAKAAFDRDRMKHTPKEFTIF